MPAIHPRVRPCGRWALLLEVDSTDEVAATVAALRDPELPDVVELVPAARTVLVSVRPGADLGPVRERVAGIDRTSSSRSAGELHTIPVVYDGEDLDLVARTAGLSTGEIVELHAGAEYTVDFCGFAPGFGYLSGLPGPLRQPRLESSRSAVPAGSVGVADVYTCVYPRRSPGGWRLIGRTDVVMFDPTAERPARLTPGDRVRFEAR